MFRNTMESIFILITLLVSLLSAQPAGYEPGELAARYCTHSTSPSKNCKVITLAHGTTSGTVIDIHIYNQSCQIVGSARGQSYSKETKVSTSLKWQNGPNYVSVKPQGMQGTLQPEVKFRGKKWGDSGKRCPLDMNIGGWVCTVDFEC